MISELAEGHLPIEIMRKKYTKLRRYCQDPRFYIWTLDPNFFSCFAPKIGAESCVYCYLKREQRGTCVTCNLYPTLCDGNRDGTSAWSAIAKAKFAIEVAHNNDARKRAVTRFKSAIDSFLIQMEVLTNGEADDTETDA